MHQAYFSTYPSVWHHGDFISITKEGSVVVHGRSDATLNPSGVRIGTAEIYRHIEKFDYLTDSLCVARKRDGGEEIVLFVKMATGEKLDDKRLKSIKATIGRDLSPRHIPRDIYAVSAIPYTRSGKKMELAISHMINNQPLDNLEAMANPECLEEYKGFVC